MRRNAIVEYECDICGAVFKIDEKEPSIGHFQLPITTLTRSGNIEINLTISAYGGIDFPRELKHLCKKDIKRLLEEAVKCINSVS